MKEIAIINKLRLVKKIISGMNSSTVELIAKSAEIEHKIKFHNAEYSSLNEIENELDGIIEKYSHYLGTN